MLAKHSRNLWKSSVKTWWVCCEKSETSSAFKTRIVLQSQELDYHLLFLICYVNGLQGPKYLTYLNSSATPLCKAPAFFYTALQEQTITSGMFWSYLKFLITFFFYTLHILHVLLQNSLCSCLSTLEGSAHLQVPEGQKLRCQLPAAAVLPQAGAAQVPGTPIFLPGGRGGRAMGPWPGHPGGSCSLGSPTDTLQLLSSRHSQESDVTLPRRWVHLLQWRDQVALHWNSQSESSPQDSLFHSKGKNMSTYIHKAAPNYCVNATCWSGYFCFMVGQQE